MRPCTFQNLWERNRAQHLKTSTVLRSGYEEIFHLMSLILRPGVFVTGELMYTMHSSCGQKFFFMLVGKKIRTSSKVGVVTGKVWTCHATRRLISNMAVNKTCRKLFWQRLFTITSNSMYKLAGNILCVCIPVVVNLQFECFQLESEAGISEFLNNSDVALLKVIIPFQLSKLCFFLFFLNLW